MTTVSACKQGKKTPSVIVFNYLPNRCSPLIAIQSVTVSQLNSREDRRNEGYKSLPKHKLKKLHLLLHQMQGIS